MKSSRRHDSLIPLSREHQYALLLCLRIHRGIPAHRNDPDWLGRKASDAIRFFESDLTPHFKAEEEILFPVMRRLTNTRGIIEELLAEHRKIECLIDRLRHADAESIPLALKEFADTLEAHARKEERQLFPIYEEQATLEITTSVERQILNAIGDARKPRHPELLE